MQSKSELRHQVLAQMRAIPSNVRSGWEQQLGELLLAECSRENYRHIGLYVGKLPEVQTLPFIQQLQQAGVSVYLPRVQANYRMSFHLFESVVALEVGAFNILQPVESAPSIAVTLLDALVVPGVVFTAEGQRIGFGGGYYDRLLETLSIPTLSLVLPVQLLPQSSWQNESHDIKIHKLLLPK